MSIWIRSLSLPRSSFVVDVEELFRPFSPPETNLLERLRYWAAAMPDRTAYRFLEAGELDNPAELTYAQLDKKARSIAAYLVAQGYAGKRAIMLYDPGLEFLAAFLGCHYACLLYTSPSPRDS